MPTVSVKLADDTVVIFTSDNGGLATLEGMPFAPTINSPLREGKGYLYEGGVRVPLIVRWPGAVKPGTVVGEDKCGEQSCLHLSLNATRKGVSYQRIELWLGKAGHEPIKADLTSSVDLPHAPASHQRLDTKVT